MSESDPYVLLELHDELDELTKPHTSRQRIFSVLPWTLLGFLLWTLLPALADRTALAALLLIVPAVAARLVGVALRMRRVRQLKKEIDDIERLGPTTSPAGQG